MHQNFEDFKIIKNQKKILRERIFKWHKKGVLEVKVMLVKVSLRMVSSAAGEKDPGVVEVWTILGANVSFGWLVMVHMVVSRNWKDPRGPHQSLAFSRHCQADQVLGLLAPRV